MNVRTRPTVGTVVDRSGTTTGASQKIMDEQGSRAYLVIQNVSDTLMRVNFGAAAVAGSSIELAAGGSVTFNGGWVPGQAVYLLCSSAAKVFVAKEGI